MKTTLQKIDDDSTTEGNRESNEIQDTSEPDFRKELQNKLRRALQLKDYALSKNFDVPSDAITNLNAAARASIAEIENFADHIDSGIKAITALTYPTTIETVSSTSTRETVNRFMSLLQNIGLGALLFAMASFAVMRAGATYGIHPLISQAMPFVLASCLGLLGCLTYIYFNVIGLLSEKAFNIEDTQANKVRLFLGFMLGWIFYFFFCRQAFDALISGPNEQGADKNQALLLLLPFLVGFSTRLVVGILNQASRAIELTLGLETKAAQLAQRNRQAGDSGRRPPSAS